MGLVFHGFAANSAPGATIDAGTIHAEVSRKPTNTPPPKHRKISPRRLKSVSQLAAAEIRVEWESEFTGNGAIDRMTDKSPVGYALCTYNEFRKHL